MTKDNIMGAVTKLWTWFQMMDITPKQIDNNRELADCTRQERLQHACQLTKDMQVALTSGHLCEANRLLGMVEVIMSYERTLPQKFMKQKARAT
jgi:hypothetical protein